MPRIPKSDVPSLIHFYALLVIVGWTLFGIFVGISAAGDVFTRIGRFFHELLWVLV